MNQEFIRSMGNDFINWLLVLSSYLRYFATIIEQNPNQTYEELLQDLRWTPTLCLILLLIVICSYNSDALIPRYHQKAQISGTHPLVGVYPLRLLLLDWGINCHLLYRTLNDESFYKGSPRVCVNISDALPVIRSTLEYWWVFSACQSSLNVLFSQNWLLCFFFFFFQKVPPLTPRRRKLAKIIIQQFFRLRKINSLTLYRFSNKI